MRLERRVPDRRVVRTASRSLRRFAVCIIGTVLSCYVVLFVFVVSRHIDGGIETELGRTATLALRNDNATVRKEAILRYFGLERIQARGALVARLMDENGKLLTARRKAFRVCTHPRFREPPGPTIALASYPGSGSTWGRYLVQQATGFLTGSVYKDFALMKYGFPAENVANGSVVLVKTHEWGNPVRRHFDRAILLIRDPYGALLAEFNRRAGGHLGHAPIEKFQSGNLWRNYVSVQLKFWTQTIMDWLTFEGPLYILRYEDITNNVHQELTKLLKFLNVTVPWPTLACVLRNKDGIFKRSKKLLDFDPFSADMHQVIRHNRDMVEQAIKLRQEKRNFKFFENMTLVQIR